jgi:protein-disulfide isomerase
MRADKERAGERTIATDSAAGVDRDTKSAAIARQHASTHQAPVVERNVSMFIGSPRRLAFAGLAAASLCFGAAPAMAQSQALSPEQRKAVVELIRETLMKNPDLVMDALYEHERRSQEAQLAAQRKAISDVATLVDPATSIIAGNPKGDVTLIEFMDYNCGFCKRGLEDVVALVKADPNLKVVVKDFPFLGPGSEEASRVAFAAKKQLSGERYWDFHLKLMRSKGQMNFARALEIARESGADVARLKKDAETDEVREAIGKVVELGRQIGIQGTPAYVVGDELVSGAVGEAVLKQKIDSVRKCGKTDCSG